MVALLDDTEMNGTIGMSMQPVGYFQYTLNGSNLPLALPVSQVSISNFGFKRRFIALTATPSTMYANMRISK